MGQAPFPLSGILVVSARARDASAPDVFAALARCQVPGASVRRLGDFHVAVWGAITMPSVGSLPIFLSAIARDSLHDVAPDALDLTSTESTAAVRGMMPAFGALQLTETTAYGVTDALGFRHLYHRQGRGWSALSTSAYVLGALAPSELDHEAVAVQAMLGWQLGNSTLTRDVTKLAAGGRVTLQSGQVEVGTYLPEDRAPETVDLSEAVPRAAKLLRSYLTAYLEEHPDAVLQLTGGLDSRILLAAIEPAQRRGLRVLTLATAPDDPDVVIAGELAARDSMEHLIHNLESLTALAPSDAHDLVMWAGSRVDGMADPVAHAALSMTEATMPQGHRISGLGGEVARGFYYFGPQIPLPVTPMQTRLLTSWRMFANQSVSDSVLDADFGRWARDHARNAVHRSLRSTDAAWFPATDHFYLYERMQRWAGVTDSAVCLDRAVVNPMLDPGFIDIANALPPRAKSNARFLSSLVCELDPELGRIPLEGRPPPAASVSPSGGQRVRHVATTVRKGVAKVRQRAGGRTLPPAGGSVLSDKVLEQWRQHPELLEPLRGQHVVRDSWLESLLEGSVQPAENELAFAASLLATVAATAASTVAAPRP
ncbi:hypothetical protein [Luteipulveratus mongoliensis]|uniref:asparagine synthase (glutamine-hydrolyzing) n=1 Tax=Luteipulveratus mongoliensis TaxID=571913 RepID=A0A0K1JH54_9MICO|nr:hypothetical protein [Luteipulveratus mongoliensis]AKU15918.1 hypothetical protein VV02_08730 [Luteipulveratus mongoliensis]